MASRDDSELDSGLFNDLGDSELESALSIPETRTSQGGIVLPDRGLISSMWFLNRKSDRLINRPAREVKNALKDKEFWRYPKEKEYFKQTYKSMQNLYGQSAVVVDLENLLLNLPRINPEVLVIYNHLYTPNLPGMDENEWITALYRSIMRNSLFSHYKLIQRVKNKMPHDMKVLVVEPNLENPSYNRLQAHKAVATDQVMRRMRRFKDVKITDIRHMPAMVDYVNDILASRNSSYNGK